ncbi:MAG: hypothetical protein JO165_08755 [Candidatus Eremiobacteraeota bacterium]|nr:hypothetical protein [Candidatus Eremiobacteraeota bacterium]
MLTLFGALCMLPFVLTLRVRHCLPLTNLGYGLLAFGLLIAGFVQRHNGGSAPLIFATALVSAGAMLLMYGTFVRKEVRAFRESLLPK